MDEEDRPSVRIGAMAYDPADRERSQGSSEAKAMIIEAQFTPAARFLLIAGAFVLVVAGLHAAASFITPFLLAGFIAAITAPTNCSIS